MSISSSLKDEIQNLIDYYIFINSFFLKLHEIFNMNFLKSCDQNKIEKILKISWIIFCIARKTILKRKNELETSSSLLLVICDMVKDIYNDSFENNTNELALNYINQNILLRDEIINQLLKILKIQDFSSLIQEFSINIEHTIEVLIVYYMEILIPDELNDLIIIYQDLEQSKKIIKMM